MCVWEVLQKHLVRTPQLFLCTPQSIRLWPLFPLSMCFYVDECTVFMRIWMSIIFFIFGQMSCESGPPSSLSFFGPSTVCPSVAEQPSRLVRVVRNTTKLNAVICKSNVFIGERITAFPSHCLNSNSSWPLPHFDCGF